VRYTHYERLLGRPESDISVPELDELDTEALERMRFSAQEPDVAGRPVPISISLPAAISEAAGIMLSPEEVTELIKLAAAQDKQKKAANNEQIGSMPQPARSP
jgi:hypothetical protein